MKVIKFLTIIIMAISLFTSCEKDRTEFIYEGEDFVHLGERTYQTIENSPDIISVLIYLSSPATSAITVDFTISDSDDPNAVAVEGVDYNFLTGGTSVTIEAGESQKALEFTPVNNLTAGDTTFKEIVITLTGNSAGLNIGLPGPAGLNSTANIIILDDDCPLLMSDWVGTHKGHEVTDWWDQTDNYVFTEGSTNESDMISLITKGFLKPQLDYWGETSVAGDQVEIILDNTDPANPLVIIPQQYMLQSVASDGVTYWDYWISSGPPVSPGTFSTCNKTMLIWYTVHWDDTYAPVSWAKFPVSFDLLNE